MPIKFKDWDQPPAGAPDAKLQKRAAELAKMNIGGSKLNPQEAQREKIAEIVLREAGIGLHLSLRQEHGLQAYQSGFQTFLSRLQYDPKIYSFNLGAMEGRFLSQDDLASGRRLDEALRARNIAELIDIAPMQEEIFEKVHIAGKKGFMGIGATPNKIEQRSTGQFKDILHSQLVTLGKDEPATRILYYCHPRDWQDYSARGGQMLIMEMILPRTIAKEVIETLQI